MSKKVETSIHIANGGNHSPVNYRKAKDMLSPHPYRRGFLYHIVLTGSEDRNVYRKAVELLCKELRKNGMPCRYKACYELDKFKRFHKHVFILIEAIDFHPDTIIHYRKGHWLTEMLAGLKLGFKIAPPQDPMHHVAGKQVNYAYVPKKAGPKLDDCLVWISYLTKVRSKEGVEGQIYTGSTNREAKKPFPPSAAPPAEQVAISVEAAQNDYKSLQGDKKPSEWTGIKITPKPHQAAINASEAHCNDKGNELKLTTAQSYLSTLYEHGVDSDMNVDEIRLHLLEQGIRKTPAMVMDDLENVLGFLGYAERHPAPPKPDMAKLDADIDRTPLSASTGSKQDKYYFPISPMECVSRSASSMPRRPSEGKQTPLRQSHR
jgi:hypothetical protein